MISEESNFITSIADDSKPVVRPWVRYWATHFDLAIATTINLILFGFLYSDIYKQRFIFLEISLVILIFMEATILAYKGTTPGKWLLNIELTTENGEKLTFLKALLRSWLVIYKGLGLEIPFISLITMYVAHNKLTTEGVTSWDKKLKLKIIHKKIGVTRIVIYIATDLVFLIIFFRMFRYFKHLG